MNDKEQLAVEVKGLTKHYANFELQGVNLYVPYGMIVGFIGENGAGKSTTIKAMLGLIQKEEGEIRVLGHVIDANNRERAWQEQIGVVFDECNMPPELTAREINKIMKNIYKTWSEDKFLKYLEEFEVADGKKVKEMSKGMKMKLSIAIAISHDSRLLILDEGTSGLDPVVRSEIMDIFREFIEDGEHSVLISSHITSDIEKVADYIIFIHQGKIVMEEAKDDLLERYGLVRCSKEQEIKIPKELIIGKMENAYGVSVLVNDARRMRQEGFVVDHACTEDILLYIVKRESRG